MGAQRPAQRAGTRSKGARDAGDLGHEAGAGRGAQVPPRHPPVHAWPTLPHATPGKPHLTHTRTLFWPPPNSSVLVELMRRGGKLGGSFRWGLSVRTDSFFTVGSVCVFVEIGKKKYEIISAISTDFPRNFDLSTVLYPDLVSSTGTGIYPVSTSYRYGHRGAATHHSGPHCH